MTYGTGLTPPSHPRFPTPFAQPEHGVGAHIAPAPAVPPLPVASRRGRRAWGWLWPVLALMLLALVAYFVTFLGAAASIVGMLAALIPYAIVIGAVVLIDRWEPEPKGLLAFAVAWGAIASVAFTLLFDLALRVAAPFLREADFFGAVVQAPIVEEVFKGLGLLLIFWMGRRAFDGPVDGVVYGAMVGAGFAFTENIQYFAIAVIEGGAAQLGFTFVLRGILSPFCHAMFTGLTGFALGLAARRGLATGPSLAYWLVGLVGAVLLHALWNGAGYVVSGGIVGWLGYYVVLQVPIFALFVFGVVLLRREEARLTRERLGEYATAGWFTPQEVDMLATPVGRRTGMAWAATLRGDRRKLMKSFIRDSASLAAARQRALSGRDPHAAEDEHVLLARIAATRQALLSY
ncbi:PrsW family intramembrane metalloprotease [Microbacterium album]|uniref:Protease PrsW n=1 Tax=Microbacterium album TaxID=2053191 RepID=A0A917IHI8_9MICO|nr:PrsW family intramembrane metalloprotease [Microbacterium album]GGH46537.1 protease PrsW [Microbacterium album]